MKHRCSLVNTMTASVAHIYLSTLYFKFVICIQISVLYDMFLYSEKKKKYLPPFYVPLFCPHPQLKNSIGGKFFFLELLFENKIINVSELI